MGLVSGVVPPDELAAAAQSLAETIAARPPIAAQSAKANLLAARAVGRDAAIRCEREMQAICRGTRDAAERRAPVFEGR